MKKRIGTIILSCVALGVLAATSGCAASPQPLETVEAAVADVPAGLDEVQVDEGKDGFSRYVVLVLVASGDELPVESVTETLKAVGGVLPDEYDSVRVAARNSSGDRLDVDAAIAASGFDGAFMINPKMADITADAIRAFADDAE
ncbi:hypothetical protein [Agromyces subbeticus]|uniref:hypothetical protein n=1 Tax=Agromyces subbeticus TaxID=293890 RepID=UPI0012EC304B|nr:hypothetical protein [Agromyces subbeticus]